MRHRNWTGLHLLSVLLLTACGGGGEQDTDTGQEPIGKAIESSEEPTLSENDDPSDPMSGDVTVNECLPWLFDLDMVSPPQQLSPVHDAERAESEVYHLSGDPTNVGVDAGVHWHSDLQTPDHNGYGFWARTDLADGQELVFALTGISDEDRNYWSDRSDGVEWYHEKVRLTSEWQWFEIRRSEMIPQAVDTAIPDRDANGTRVHFIVPPDLEYSVWLADFFLLNRSDSSKFDECTP